MLDVCVCVCVQVAYAAAQAGLGCAYTDIAPLYSSSLNSLGNTVGSIAGIVGPIIVAAFTDSMNGASGWRAAFLLTFVMCVIVYLLWIRFIKAEIVAELNSPAKLSTDPH